jgi:hypothetical protein
MKSFEKFLAEGADPQKKPEPKKANQVSPKPQPLTEPTRVADDLVTTFGRYNPPHLGHGLTLDYANKLSQSLGDTTLPDQRFYASRSQDPKKNPLPFQLKIDYLKKMFPDHAEKWDDDDSTKTILNAATKAHEKGYKNFHFVGGSDRRQGMEDLLRRYNGNLYNFKNIYSHSAGDRDESGDDPIAKLSASGQRRAVMNGDFEKFKEGMKISKKGMTMDDAKRLFDQLKMFMVKNEEWENDARGHQEVIMELYKTKQLFSPGDIVEHVPSGLQGRVHRCGTNYLICLTDEKVMFKSFLHDVYHI